MARKTIKGLEEIILDLEKRLNEYKDIINARNKQIEQMENITDDSFENSPTYRQMDKQIDHLNTVIKGHEISIKDKKDTIKKNRNTIQELLKENEGLKSENNQLKGEINNLKAEIEQYRGIVKRLENSIENPNNDVNKLKNERGAGRKEMFTEEQKARVKMLRLQGKSYRAIAKDMNCSVATVHKIINEQQY